MDSFLALCYNAVFAVRRFDIILMNIYFTEGSPISGVERSQYLHKIICFLYIQMLYLSYIHCVHPHSESIYNKLEFVNEYCMVLLAYAMLNFTQIGTI